MPLKLRREDFESQFSARLEELSEARLADCYQCGKCSAGCPVASQMDILPHMINRLAQLGLYEQALSSETIWLCASCVTCTARCPKEVDLAAIMDALREMSLETRKAAKRSREIIAFHKAFLDTVWAYGRLAEFTLVGDYKLRSRKLLQDVSAAPGMLRRGKLRLLPKRIAGRKEIRDIFRKCGC